MASPPQTMHTRHGTYDPNGAPFSITGTVLVSGRPPLSHSSSNGTTTVPRRSFPMISLS